MPRKGHIAKREVAADPVYNSTLVTKFVNSMMWGGKKSTAQGIFYDAMKQVEKKGGDEYRIYGQVRQEGVPKDFRTLVPVQVDFGKNDIVRIGMLGMTGEATVPIDATLKLPKAPKRALVNAHGEVLARD